MAKVRQRSHSNCKAASMERAPLAHRAGGMTDRVTNGNIHSEHHDKGGHHDNRGLAEGCIPSVEKRRSGVRVFRNVESLTNQLVATDPNFQAVYDIILVHFVLFIFYKLMRDSLQAGRLFLDVSLLSAGLGSVSIFFTVELYLLASFLLVHPCLKIWVYLHRWTSVPRVLSGALFVSLFVSYVASSAVLVCWICLTLPLAPFTTIILSVEQLRLCMKSYSFVRENVYKVLYPWSEGDQTGPVVWYSGQMSPQVGSFSQYLYFLFAPTLLYRDHYPRNSGPIKWHDVLAYFVQFIGTIWYLSILCKEMTFPYSLSWSSLMGCYLSCLLCVFLGYVLVHTCVFHAYMNMVSELLRFADREFYQDWWTSTSFSSYYRKWNRIVHDWIHAYLYTDLKNLFKSQIPAVFGTTLVSAFIHEYLLALVLRFASPVLMLEFGGLGVMFYLMRPHKKRRLSNLLVLLALCFGGSNLVFYYQVEMASRMYCPKELTWWTFFKPRMFECYYSYHYGNITHTSF